jgi:hypothetical protein
MRVTIIGKNLRKALKLRSMMFYTSRYARHNLETAWKADKIRGTFLWNNQVATSGWFKSPTTEVLKFCSNY